MISDIWGDFFDVCDRCGCIYEISCSCHMPLKDRMPPNFEVACREAGRKLGLKPRKIHVSDKKNKAKVTVPGRNS